MFWLCAFHAVLVVYLLGLSSVCLVPVLKMICAYTSHHIHLETNSCFCISTFPFCHDILLRMMLTDYKFKSYVYISFKFEGNPPYTSKNLTVLYVCTFSVLRCEATQLYTTDVATLSSGFRLLLSVLPVAQPRRYSSTSWQPNNLISSNQLYRVSTLPHDCFF